jgi:hypothetical protein
MSKSDPSRTKSRIHQGCLAFKGDIDWHKQRQIYEYDSPKVFPGNIPLSLGKVPYADGIPTNSLFGLTVNKFMSKNEQFRMELGDMVHASNMERHGSFVNGNKAQYPMERYNHQVRS